jgi:hypothetical protein
MSSSRNLKPCTNLACERHIVLARLEGWEQRLAAFIEQRRERPFEWAGNCCVSFAIDAVEIVTGRRLWNVTWSTATEAARLMAGAGGLEAATTSVLGPSAPKWQHVRRGDIALVETAGRQSLAICTGQSLAAPGVHRLEHLPLNAALAVWLIG